LVRADGIVVSAVRTVVVTADDDDIRLDRWFKKHFPDIGHGYLQKLLRTGQVRLDGGRAKAGERVKKGQTVGVPPMPSSEGAMAERKPKTPTADPKITAELQRRVLYRDSDVLVIDKPAGLAVQGGTGQAKHLDGYLDALRFDADERPRLVHRLDKDTSGVLVLARSAAAARWLTEAFRQRDTRKLYWAVVVGVPKLEKGIIDAPLDKRHAGAGERMELVDPGEGLAATTVYRTLARASRLASWLAMEPLTGRTHQLRVHAADALSTPVLGDGKYGGALAFLDASDLSKKLHLHARAIRIPLRTGRTIEALAPLPDHMKATFSFFGFEENQDASEFLEP
jgi:23S rRNA pseudouridine955/2504/2580 synthase